MKKCVYQSELEQIRYTDPGRSALTDRLMSAQELEEAARRRSPWIRRIAAAAVAAALLVGSAMAIAGPLWERYFGPLDESQQAVIAQLSGDLPAVTSNGTVMTPLSAFGDQDFYYLLLEITAPEGTVLREYGEDEGYYQLFGDNPGENITLTSASGEELSMMPEFTWIDDNPSDNVLTAALLLWSMDETSFDDGTDKILHIPGLWVQSPDKIYTPILSGSWDFNIGGHIGESQTKTLDVSNAAIPHEFCGTLTLDFLRISSLGMRWRFHWSEPVEDVMPDAEIGVVLDDGTEVFISNTVGSGGEDWSESLGPFTAPIDLSRVTGVRWGSLVIPVN